MVSKGDTKEGKEEVESRERSCVVQRAECITVQEENSKHRDDMPQMVNDLVK